MRIRRRPGSRGPKPKIRSMKNTSGSSTVQTALPTLGDRPSSGFETPGFESSGGPSKVRGKRRFGRKLIVASAAVVIVLVGATSAFASFNDTSGNPFAADIDWLASHGIASGQADGGYHPNDPVSRGSMARFIHNLNKQTTTVEVPFSFSGQIGYSGAAYCPAGKTPIAGGGSAGFGWVMMDSYPYNGGWHASWISPTGSSGSGSGSIYVICQAAN